MRITAAVEIDLRDAPDPRRTIGYAVAVMPPGTVVKIIVDRHTIPALVLPHLPADAPLQLVADEGTTIARWHAAIRGDAS